MWTRTNIKRAHPNPLATQFTHRYRSFRRCVWSGSPRSRLLSMSSIKERIARLNGGGSSKSVAPPSPSKDHPEGEIVWHGWLGKAGAGILSSTYN